MRTNIGYLIIVLLLIIILPGSNSVLAIVGETMEIGDTWDDYQHSGSIGRMIAKDSEGGLHFTWMDAYDQDLSSRHVQYGFWDGEELITVQADGCDRAGYCSLSLIPANQSCVIFYHGSRGMGDYFNYQATDFNRGFGGFESCRISQPEGISFIWPKGVIDRINRSHIIATEPVTEDNPIRRIGYWRGVPDEDFSEWEFSEEPIIVDSTGVISAVVAASRTSDRVALAWHHNRAGADADNWGNYQDIWQRNNDLRYIVSEDGEEWDWENGIQSITKIYPPIEELWEIRDPQPIERNPLDPDDIETAYGDIWRPFCDVDIQFEPWGDELCGVFSTTAMWERPFPDDEGKPVDNYSLEQGMLWFWSWEQDTLTLVYNGWYFNRSIYDETAQSRCGYQRVNADRGSIAFDSENEGTIYIVWVNFPQIMDWDEENEQWIYLEGASDTTALGYSNAEIMVSVSTDYGMTWLEPVNITETRWIEEQAPADGESMSENYPSVAYFADEELHIQYFLERGGDTESLVMHHHVPVADLNIENLETMELPYEGFRFHNYWFLDVFDDEPGASEIIPDRCSIDAIHPNPFNSTTTISYSLPIASQVSLKVFDLSGRKVKSLVEGCIEAGNHTVSLTGDGMASGVYMVRMKAGEKEQVRKVLLVR